MSWFAGLEQLVRENEPLATYTWLHVGGNARYYAEPQTIEQLSQVVAAASQASVPVRVLGSGANVLICDEGFDGLVIRLASAALSTISVEGTTIRAGAGANLNRLVQDSVRAGLGGLECLAGIPGTVGGALTLNAGGAFGDIGSAVSSIELIDARGNTYTRQRDELVFNYRTTNIDAPVVAQAQFELNEEDPQQILKTVREIWINKKNSQPLQDTHVGCIFKNPRQLSAGALIDRAGLKNTRVGQARVSERHGNFIVTESGVRAADVLELIEIIRNRVRERFGVTLELQIVVWR